MLSNDQYVMCVLQTGHRQKTKVNLISLVSNVLLQIMCQLTIEVTEPLFFCVQVRSFWKYMTMTQNIICIMMSQQDIS